MADRRGAAFLFLLTLYQAFHSAHCTLSLDTPDPVVQVNEQEVRQLVLNTSPITCTDTEGNSTRVYWKSTSPTTLCGKCFQVWPRTSGTGYDLVFIRTFGTLKYGTRSSYMVTLGCTDDIDPEVIRSIEVRIIPNTPPHFTVPSVSYTLIKPDVATLIKKSDKLIYDVDAEDSDNDAVFYTMSDDPATGLFDIGYANGKITPKKNLNLLCDPSVQFYVTVADDYNSPVGQVIIDSAFVQTNKAPLVPADVTIQIPETLAISSEVYKLNVTDDGVSSTLQYTLRATPERGLDYYYLDPAKKKILTRTAIDYEYLDLRTVTLTIDVNDGYCKGPSQKVTVQITDVNEIPVVAPEKREVTVYEGFINVDPQWNLIDPDEHETHKWSVVTGKGKLDVDEDTGEIFSVGEMDIDPNKPSQTFLMSLRVEDKNNAGANPEPRVKVIVLDKNDNTPIFNQEKYTVSASPCSKVGKVLDVQPGGRLRATDKDSEFQGNNLLVFSGHSRNMSVMANGEVILTQPCEPEGAFDSLLAYVTDQGLYPGPLVGVPVPVTLTCGPCPSPAPSTGGGNTTTNGTGTGATVDTSNTTNFFDANLSWLVPAILLGSILLGLLAYLLWRYCSRACARSQAARAISQKSTQAYPAKPKPPKKEVRTKQKKPAPPTPPDPEPEPVLFGFWKETYPDRDQRHMPKRQANPASVEADKQIAEKEKKEEEEEKQKRKMERQKQMEDYQKELEEYHKKVNEINNANRSGNPAPPKKRCTIL